MAIGVIQSPNGYPVMESSTGTSAEIKTGPYTMSDGVSIAEPLPITIVMTDHYTDSAGNLRDVWPMNISGLTSPPSNVSIPTITGSARVGQTLTASTGVWTGNPEPTYAYQWRRGGTNISGATGATYAPVQADAGLALSVVITATNSEGSANATSANTALVGAPPVTVTAPSTTGTPAVGQMLSTNGGTFSGYPAPTRVYAWLRDDVTIAGATSTTYTLQPDDAGAVMKARVTAANLHGSTTSTNSGTTRVIMQPTNTEPPAITGVGAVDEFLVMTTGDWQGYPTPEFTFTWSRDGVPIAGATMPTYMVTVDDVGAEITGSVTATNIAGTSTVQSPDATVVA